MPRYWRPSDAPRERETLTDAVRRLRLAQTGHEYPMLATHPLLADYPHADWLSRREMDYLRCVAWRFQHGDNDG